MIDLSLDLKKDTENKLLSILKRYKNREIFAKNIIENEILELKRAIINIEIDLKKFEIKSKLSSEKFYDKFSSDDIDNIIIDSKSSIIWAGIYEIFLDNKKRLSDLLSWLKNISRI